MHCWSGFRWQHGLLQNYTCNGQLRRSGLVRFSLWRSQPGRKCRHVGGSHLCRVSRTLLCSWCGCALHLGNICVHEAKKRVVESSSGRGSIRALRTGHRTIRERECASYLSSVCARFNGSLPCLETVHHRTALHPNPKTRLPERTGTRTCGAHEYADGAVGLDAWAMETYRHGISFWHR